MMQIQSETPRSFIEAMALRRSLVGEREAARQITLLRIPRAERPKERRQDDRRRGDRRQD